VVNRNVGKWDAPDISDDEELPFLELYLPPFLLIYPPIKRNCKYKNNLQNLFSIDFLAVIFKELIDIFNFLNNGILHLLELGIMYSIYIILKLIIT